MSIWTRIVWMLIGWGLVIFVIYLSLVPTPIQVPGDGGDKVAHALAYAVMMGWFASVYETLTVRVVTAIALIGMGVGLEFVQGWSGLRTFEVADMVADAAGVGIGWLLAPPRLPNFLRLFDKVFR